MPLQETEYARSPEAILAGLARNGDRDAFAELVKRRQAWIRNLMRRCCNDAALADDLAQQVFLRAWKNIPQLQRVSRFGAWLNRIAVNVWLQQLRKSDPLKHADEVDDNKPAPQDPAGMAIDLDRALATLSDPVRLCIVLSYYERMTHGEIADLTGLPPGTVKSHIRRGTQRLQKYLSAYDDSHDGEQPS